MINKDAQIAVSCDGCKYDTDCNLNGQCLADGQCDCHKAVGHYGKHCEHAKPCPGIIGADYNDTWYVVYSRDCETVRAYGRPVYALTRIDHAYKIANGVTTLHDDDMVYLMFAGSRWIVILYKGGKSQSLDDLKQQALESHPFWDRTYDDRALVVSDPTTGSFPVGVDFYKIGERGQQYGPMGLLHPLQSPPGRGIFRCHDNMTGIFGGLNNNLTEQCS